MFKLQFVLCLFLSIQLNAIIALPQFPGLNYIDANIIPIETEIIPDVNPEFIEGDLLHPPVVAIPEEGNIIISYDTEVSPDVNPEEGEFIEGDLLNPIVANHEEGNFVEADLHNPTESINHNDIQNTATTNGQLSYSVKPENNEILVDEKPEEGDHIEGDLLYPPGDLRHSSILKTGSLWPGGLVPYELNGIFKQAEIRPLLYAFDQYSAKTCIKFYPRTTEEDYVSIVKLESGCASNVGRIGGKQKLNLGANCFRHGTIMHELMHALGFLHEQNTYDRDDYVKIIYENLLPGHEINFKKFSIEQIKNLGIPYDYGSIMHYVDNAFSKNRKRTIVALKKMPKGVKMGQRDGFSLGDLEKINRKYKCDNSKLNRK